DRLRPPDRPASPVAAALVPWSEVAKLAPVPSGLWAVPWRAQPAAGRLDVARRDGPGPGGGPPARYLAAHPAASGPAPGRGPGAAWSGRSCGTAPTWPPARSWWTPSAPTRGSPCSCADRDGPTAGRRHAGRQLAAGGVDLDAPVAPHGGVDPEVAQPAVEPLDPGRRRPRGAEARGRVERDEVHVGGERQAP